MKRVAAAALLLWACSGRQPPEIPTPDSPRIIIAVAPAVANYLTMLHFRLWGHTALPDHEWVTCLRGSLRPDTAWVTDIGVAVIVSYTDSSVRHQKCEGDGIIGLAHNHLPTVGFGDACWHSTTDAATQDEMEYAISIVSCGGEKARLIGRVHPRYRQLAAAQ